MGKVSVSGGGGIFDDGYNSRGSFTAFTGGGTQASAILPFTKGLSDYDNPGPLSSWLYTNYFYATQSSECPDGALNKAHAVTAVGNDSYCYDENGNMVRRIEDSTTYIQNFDAENRLTSVQIGSDTTTFVYDGDGNLVKQITAEGITTAYVAGIYEVETDGSKITKKSYYPSGAMRVDMNGK